jgi:PAS domain S-box-containing protein
MILQDKAVEHNNTLNDTKKNSQSSLNFFYFPAYAKFLLDNKLHEFVIEQLKVSKEMPIPLLNFFKNFSEEELIPIATDGIKRLLTYCSENNCEDYINDSIQKWHADQLPIITRDQVSVEDITFINCMRRKLFRHFVKYYTSDLNLIINIMNEVDLFTVAIDTRSFKALTDAQQQLYKQAQALAHIGNWQWNLETKKLTWSDEIFKIYDLEPQLFISSQQIAQYNHPDDAETINKYIQGSKDTLKPHDFYYRIILKNGVQKTLHAKGEVKLNSNQMPVELYGTLQDVTEQKQNEKALEESRKLIEKIANISPCIISVYNVNTGKYIFMNAAIKSILGYSQQDMYENDITFLNNLVHPEDLQSLLRKNEKALNDANKLSENSAEQVVEYIYRIKNKNGEYRLLQTFETVFNRDANFKVKENIDVSIDITPNYALTQKLAVVNEEIRKKDEQYHRMISEVEDYAILLLNKEGIIQNWNKGAEKIKGYTADEIIGKSFKVFYRKEDQERKLPESLIQKATNEGKASHEGWRVRKDGTFFWGSVLITALHDEYNNVIGFSKVTRNLTDKKIADDQLKEYASRIEIHNAELIRINKELDSFTYMASHDLQEPLRKIKTFCNLIFERGINELTAETASYFKRITYSVERMQALIKSLLDYSRTNAMEIKFEATDLNIIVSKVKQELSEKIAEKHVVITTNNLPVLKVIAVQFEQLIFNVLENSIKYSRENVPLEIDISYKFFKEADTQTGMHEICIKDNGIGFENQYAENIFKIFQRLHGRNEYSGTGVGLTICKKIVENHCGTITAFGEPGKGSVFTILLPDDCEGLSQKNLANHETQ